MLLQLTRKQFIVLRQLFTTHKPEVVLVIYHDNMTLIVHSLRIRNKITTTAIISLELGILVIYTSQLIRNDRD